MPLYEYECQKCKKYRTDIRCIAQRYLSPKCDGCSEPMKLQVSAVYGTVQNPAVPKGK